MLVSGRVIHFAVMLSSPAQSHIVECGEFEDFFDRRKRMLEAWQSPLTSKDVMVWSVGFFVVNFAYLLEAILYEKDSSNSWVLYWASFRWEPTRLNLPILSLIQLICEAPADDRPTISLVVVGHVDAGYFLTCLKNI